LNFESESFIVVSDFLNCTFFSKVGYTDDFIGVSLSKSNGNADAETPRVPIPFNI